MMTNTQKIKAQEAEIALCKEQLNLMNYNVMLQLYQIDEQMNLQTHQVNIPVQLKKLNTLMSQFQTYIEAIEDSEPEAIKKASNEHIKTISA